MKQEESKENTEKLVNKLTELFAANKLIMKIDNGVLNDFIDCLSAKIKDSVGGLITGNKKDLFVKYTMAAWFTNNDISVSSEPEI